MAKRQQKRRGRRPPKRPSSGVVNEVAAAMELFAEGDTHTAQNSLRDLATRHPGNQMVLHAMLDVSLEAQDWHTVALCGEQLLPRERESDRANLLNTLIFAYVQLQYLALAWQYARELTTHYPDFEHFEQVHSFLETVEPVLWQQIQETMDETELSDEEKRELRVLHDRVRFLTESRQPQESIRAAERLLSRMPNALPVLNNVSLSQFMLGDIDQAIATALNVLTQDANNYHALANLVRYHFLSAQFDQARAYALQLENVDGDDPDLEMKRAEAFAFLGDDNRVWAAYEKAKAKQAEVYPLMLHLAAVAAYRLGNESTAWRLWKKAVNQQPAFDLAQDSLADKRLPVGERNVPWYWPLEYWFPQDMKQLLERHVGNAIRRRSEKQVEQGMMSMLAERPYLAQLFPHILERGDRSARKFVLNFIRIADTPDLLQQLVTFAQSHYGSDDLRLEAIQFISENHPRMLPDDLRVPMWINGQQSEIFMIAFEITDEPESAEEIAEAALETFARAHDLLLEDRATEAEALLHEVIAEAPEFCSAYNQLAVALERQGRSREARKLVEETHARFPDYFFARVSLARIRAGEKRVEEARALLEPLIRLPRLHISEFRALAIAEMDVALADNQVEAARTWLDMWLKVEPDNPEIISWRIRIDGPRQWPEALRRHLGRGRG